MCIRYCGNVSTEPLPSNGRGIFTSHCLANDMVIFTELLPSNAKGIHIDKQTDGRDILIRPLRWAQMS
jgi:hypothetical protein